MSKQPIKFKSSVETGNSKLAKTGILPNKYLAAEPINPPKPTIKKLTIKLSPRKNKMPMTLLIS